MNEKQVFKKRKCISLEVKIEIIKEHTEQKITSLQSWPKNTTSKANILEHCEKNLAGPEKMRIKLSSNDNVDQAVLYWFDQAILTKKDDNFNTRPKIAKKIFICPKNPNPSTTVWRKPLTKMPIDEPKNRKISKLSKQNNFYILGANIAINLRKFLYIFHIYYSYFPEPDTVRLNSLSHKIPKIIKKSKVLKQQDDQR
ncbi:hypothetical protein BpHYR1_040003 [Brachionus plicatilis]|uniref:Uncharacterized protein n=1 Tax=Brachionus plicatilis TaxID=10195 RepID=A0A3M7RGT5_BRAPC|nr:hypothetical protein BpHYR1_040003 [Brachionus plicatilis]